MCEKLSLRKNQSPTFPTPLNSLRITADTLLYVLLRIWLSQKGPLRRFYWSLGVHGSEAGVDWQEMDLRQPPGLWAQHTPILAEDCIIHLQFHSMSMLPELLPAGTPQSCSASLQHSLTDSCVSLSPKRRKWTNMNEAHRQHLWLRAALTKWVGVRLLSFGKLWP